MTIVIGTRGSKLARIQSEQVKQMIQQVLPEETITERIILTQGDRNQTAALHEFGTQGVFVKEIEQQLLDHSIDIAVHSMKDLPAFLHHKLCLVDPINAEDPRDVIVCRNDEQNIAFLKQSHLIGTGSKRRSALLHQLYPQCQIKGIRGNVDSRLKKLADGEYDGLILAAAGLHRLGYDAKICAYLDPTCFIPSPCQGILGIQIRKEDRALMHALQAIADEAACLRMKGERAFLQAVNGDCHMPIGAYLQIDAERCTLYGLLGDEEHLVQGVIHGTKDMVADMGHTLGLQLRGRLEAGAWES